jgi:hypothetical protein
MKLCRFPLGCVLLIEVLALGACTGCSKRAEPVPTESVAPAPTPTAEPIATAKSAEPPPAPPPVEIPVPGPEAVAAGASGTLKIEPNPVPICDKTGVGMATVKWTISGTKYAEVRVGTPSGNLFASVKAGGVQKTGQWVGKQTVFFLQNGSDGRPENTMARIVPDVAPGGPCPAAP